ncbi:Alpha/Beta hydrolase protein [Cristinia sonorae]|uniref:Alpha/Beta hydrolase protein n=1 Tax=Cristinia sonorae TaxID=1940300 RepID=A0A8K0USF2_9AGAR|nr:Alpha/Beta hydrolase protein [Cristinia sonorae]
MIGRSIPEYVFIRISIFFLRAIAPFSIAYILYYLGLWYFGKRNDTMWSTVLGTYAISEAIFYLFVYLPRSQQLQKPADHPRSLSPEERRALFTKCFAQVRHSELATGWFHPSPASELAKGNLMEWLSWALFSTYPGEVQKESENELLEYVDMLEGLMGRCLPSGRNGEVQSMRITLDPVVSCHRPLVWYLIVGLIDTYTCFTLSRSGFRHYSQDHWFSHFPPRIYPRPSRPSPHPDVSYWYRPHRSSTKKPILFLHGIGIGLWTYCPFLSELIASDPDVGILAIENFAISMRMSPTPLNRAEMLAALTEILDSHGLSQIVVAGHSYGTVLAAHILKDPVLSARVKAWQLVDPIPFLLHLPAVAYNFVYRRPRFANEWQLWYFASRDLDVARFLARHFFWADNILWKEDLERKRVGVALSERDQVVDVREVWRYLTEQEEMASSWKGSDLEVLFYPGLDHSQVYDTTELRRPLVKMLLDFCEDDGPNDSH